MYEKKMIMKHILLFFYFLLQHRAGVKLVMILEKCVLNSDKIYKEVNKKVQFTEILVTCRYKLPEIVHLV